MTAPALDPPFIWPDSRKLVGCPGPTLGIDNLLAESQLVLGVVHGFTGAGVARLAQALTPTTLTAHSGNGHPTPTVPDKRIRLVVTLYPTCPTRIEALTEL